MPICKVTGRSVAVALACLVGIAAGAWPNGGAIAQPAAGTVAATAPGAGRFPYQRQSSDTLSYDAPDPHSLPLEVQVEQLNKEVADLRDSREKDEAKLRDLIGVVNTLTKVLQGGR